MKLRFIEIYIQIYVSYLITGPPTHSVERQYCFASWRLSSSVTLHGGPAGGYVFAGVVMQVGIYVCGQLPGANLSPIAMFSGEVCTLLNALLYVSVSSAVK